VGQVSWPRNDTFVDEPADKLYNEGLYLMNQKKDPKAASRNSRKSTASTLIPDWARKSLLMSAYAFYNSGDYVAALALRRAT